MNEIIVDHKVEMNSAECRIRPEVFGRDKTWTPESE